MVARLYPSEFYSCMLKIKEQENELKWIKLMNYAAGLIAGLGFMITFIFLSFPVGNVSWISWPSYVIYLSILITLACFYFKQKYFAFGLASGALSFSLLLLLSATKT
jgi:hypothetical protein